MVGPTHVVFTSGKWIVKSKSLTCQSSNLQEWKLSTRSPVSKLSSKWTVLPLKHWREELNRRKQTLGESRTDAINATLPQFMQPAWGYIWKLTWVRSLTNATNVTMHLLRQANWRIIWKLILEKSRTNATYAAMHLLRWAICGHILKLTLERSRTNAINATLHLFRQAIWEDT